MVECKCCRQSISPKAQTCPHCGEPTPVPPAPPPPLTIWNVFEAFGVDRPMAVCLAAVFCGASAATWVFYGLNESRQRQEQSAQATAERDRNSPDAAQPGGLQSPPAREERQTSNEPPPRR